MLSTFLTISIIINILVIYLFINSQRKLEISEEANEFFLNFYENLKLIIGNSQKRIEEVDQRGHFKSDNEIGYFFNLLKDIQTSLNEQFK
jgi:ABC-type long-subunit fatty acid transport system fused permease/ATPase subunit